MSTTTLEAAPHSDVLNQRITMADVEAAKAEEAKEHPKEAVHHLGGLAMKAFELVDVISTAVGSHGGIYMTSDFRHAIDDLRKHPPLDTDLN